MSGAHAKKEMVIGEKSATSHGKAPSGGVRQQEEGGITSPRQVAPEWRQEEENEEGGLLRDRFFVALHLWLRHAFRHF
jgi:hypothetical protein